jgi:SAM-dependent methyltransferases related to tRNA (uracil-5-)-methyltransferase
MDEEVCRLIAQLKPDAFIYISCNPATQARDIARMKSISNMEISYARVFDQFPETISMESIIMAEFIQ